MAVDELLLEEAAGTADCALRFYEWSHPTLSLGYFQPYADRARHASSRQCPVVRRSTGGGAILHDRELTYSFVTPARSSLAGDPRTLYRLLHGTLADALGELGIQATLRDCPKTATPAHSRSPDDSCNRPALTGPRGEPFLCFRRAAESDLLVGNSKICGSAQRRRRGAVLQHGSVLLARSPAAPEIAGLAELTGVRLSASRLIELWLPRLAAALDTAWCDAPLASNEEESIRQLVQQKHGNPAWIERR